MLNCVFLSGCVMRDLQLTFASSGLEMVHVPLIVHHTVSREDCREKIRAMRIDAMAMGKTAQRIVNVIRKGSRIFIYGRLEGRDIEARINPRYGNRMTVIIYMWHRVHSNKSAANGGIADAAALDAMYKTASKTMVEAVRPEYDVPF